MVSKVPVENFYQMSYRQREWLEMNSWRHEATQIHHDPKLQLTLTNCQSKEAFPDPPSDEFDLQLLIKGRIHVDHLDVGFGRDKGSFGAGTWAARPSGAPFNIWGEGNFQILTLSFPWQRLADDINQETGRDVSHLGSVHQSMKQDALIESLVTQLWEARDSEPVHKDSLVTLLIQRLWQLSALDTSPSNPMLCRLDKVRLHRVIDSLHSQFLDPLTLDEVAQIAGLSRYHFLRAFKESTGFTPHAYLRRLRVNYGKNLLEQGNSCIEAAYAAGFADQAHFTRTFKTFYRITPKQYLLNKQS